MIWLELLGWWLLFVAVIDAVVIAVILTIVGLWRLLKRFFMVLVPYRENPTL